MIRNAAYAFNAAINWAPRIRLSTNGSFANLPQMRRASPRISGSCLTQISPSSRKAHRTGDVFDADLSKVHQIQLEPVPHLIAHGPADNDAVRGSERFQARRNVHAIAFHGYLIARLDDFPIGVAICLISDMFDF